MSKIYVIIDHRCDEYDGKFEVGAIAASTSKEKIEQKAAEIEKQNQLHIKEWQDAHAIVSQEFNRRNQEYQQVIYEWLIMKADLPEKVIKEVCNALTLNSLKSHINYSVHKNKLDFAKLGEPPQLDFPSLEWPAMKEILKPEIVEVELND